MPAAYLPLLFLAILVLCFPIIVLTVLKMIGRSSRAVPGIFQPEESATPAENLTSDRDFARFYIIAALFVILGVVTIFLYPWAVMFRAWLAAHLAALALLSISVFLGILLAGYILLYKKGALALA
jgi:NADH-quinone oxidoreductase subunit A